MRPDALAHCALAKRLVEETCRTRDLNNLQSFTWFVSQRAVKAAAQVLCKIELRVCLEKMMLANTTGGNPVTFEKGPVIAFTARIVAAYVVKHSVPTAQVPDLIARTFRALNGLGQEPVTSEVPEISKPAVSVRQSIKDDYLISLEDGKKFKSLKRHLMVKYGMTPEDYRSKWGLPSDYPMVAPNYSAKRSELARETGLGIERSRSAATKQKS